MGRQYTEAQAKASREYMKKNTVLRVVVSKERKEIIEEYAKANGESMSAFINRAINETMEREKGLE